MPEPPDFEPQNRGFVFLLGILFGIAITLIVVAVAAMKNL